MNYAFWGVAVTIMFAVFTWSSDPPLKIYFAGACLASCLIQWLSYEWHKRAHSISRPR